MDITVRNQKTGQASGDSKIARLSDLESSALQAINADYSLKELLGPRAKLLALNFSNCWNILKLNQLQHNL